MSAITHGRYDVHTPSHGSMTVTYHKTRERAVGGDEAAEETLLLYAALAQIVERLDRLAALVGSGAS